MTKARSLKNRLTLSYMLVAVICVVLISVLSNYILDNQFKEYVIGNIQTKSLNVQTLINNAVSTGGSFKPEVVENIGVDALQNGLLVKLVDRNGKVIWDARSHNNGACDLMLKHLSENMSSRYPNWKGGYVENTYPVTYSSSKEMNRTGNKIAMGTIKIGYYGPYYYLDNELFLLNKLNTIFVAVGIISLLIAIAIGLLMAANISRPVLEAVNTAEFIARGHYSERSKLNSSIQEINTLTRTINNLADTLEKQDKLRKQLTADVAHELRTPITTLQSHLEAIVDGVWEPTTERIQSCLEETTRLGKITYDLEKLTRFESEGLQLAVSEFDLSKLIKPLLLNFEQKFSERNIKLVYEESPMTIAADRDKLGQVLVNLISNALKYTEDGGIVTVLVNRAVDNRKSYVDIRVKDTGIGISEEDLTHVFERFYRVDKSRCRATGGSGIGLTIAKAIIDAHGGHINVCSEPEKGTEFLVRLPQVTNDAS